MSGEWASGKLLKLLLSYVTLQMCRTRTIGQHELFEHIIGIWRSAVIRNRIVTSCLDVCQAQWMLIIFPGDVGVPIWDESPSATDLMLFIPATYRPRSVYR
jgi:hypothetical protein